MPYFVYILASRQNGTLYREGLADGFTKRYGVKRLVHYETYDDVRRALQREKNIKHWSRAWKIALVEEQNPHWSDLWSTIARP